MGWSEIVVIVSAVITAVVALSVPLLAYRFGLKQEHRSWIRDQRVNLYIELLSMIDEAAAAVEGADDWNEALDAVTVVSDRRPTLDLQVEVLASPLIRAAYVRWIRDGLSGAADDSEKHSDFKERTAAHRSGMVDIIREELGSNWFDIPIKPNRFA